jgi:hypothetical protein
MTTVALNRIYPIGISGNTLWQFFLVLGLGHKNLGYGAHFAVECRISLTLFWAQVRICGCRLKRGQFVESYLRKNEEKFSPTPSLPLSLSPAPLKPLAPPPKKPSLERRAAGVAITHQASRQPQPHLRKSAKFAAIAHRLFNGCAGRRVDSRVPALGFDRPRPQPDMIALAAGGEKWRETRKGAGTGAPGAGTGAPPLRNPVSLRNRVSTFSQLK